MKYPIIVGNVFIGKTQKSNIACDNEPLEKIELHIDKEFKEFIMKSQKHYKTETFKETFACWLNGEIHSASCGAYNINTFLIREKKNKEVNNE